MKMTNTSTSLRTPFGVRWTCSAFVLFSILLVASAGCGVWQDETSTTTRGVIVVNAPAAGEVRRVFVREGMSVAEGDPVVEIVVRTEAPGQAAPTPGEDPQARAAGTVRAAQSEIDSARAEVVRYEVEVARLTPLVAAGQASQGELDGARARYEVAQQRLRQAQESAQSAQTGLAVARQQSLSDKPATVPTTNVTEQVVHARATSAGTVSIVSAREGDKVTAGQPLATLRAGAR
ncbi:MAG TPA: hypothetical protein VGV38_05890 [Pyrinomonadaceae bacterium]|nr:hypothetical protein [Pyrinomonadaceae bacterium]